MMLSPASRRRSVLVQREPAPLRAARFARVLQVGSARPPIPLPHNNFIIGNGLK